MLGLSIEVVWHDADPEDIDLMELRVSADGGPFRGRAKVYALPHEIDSLAQKFRGFPSSAEDGFHFDLGASSHHNRVFFAARCFNRAGNSILTVHLEEGAVDVKFDGHPQVAEIVFRFEALAADEFAAALKQIAAKKAGRAHLAGIN
jgi:hypothetical protein